MRRILLFSILVTAAAVEALGARHLARRCHVARLARNDLAAGAAAHARLDTIKRQLDACG